MLDLELVAVEQRALIQATTTRSPRDLDGQAGDARQLLLEVVAQLGGGGAGATTAAAGVATTAPGVLLVAAAAADSDTPSLVSVAS